jgi:hypothetical protein
MLFVFRSLGDHDFRREQEAGAESIVQKSLCSD